MGGDSCRDPNDGKDRAMTENETLKKIAVILADSDGKIEDGLALDLIWQLLVDIEIDPETYRHANT